MIKKVYIIDDDEISVYLTSLMLEITAFAEEIHTFFSVDAAFEKLLQEDPQHLPEVILLDLNLPQKSGWDFLDMLQSHDAELTGKTNIYILTSSIADSDKKQSESYPLVSGFLHKPLDEESIELIQQKLQRQNNW